MTAHLSDRALLAQLIRAAEAILSAPLVPSPGRLADLGELRGDLGAALRCPAPGARIGAAEGILFSCLQEISKGGAISTGALYRFAFVAQQVLPMVRDHYFAVVAAAAREAAPCA